MTDPRLLEALREPNLFSEEEVDGARSLRERDYEGAGYFESAPSGDAARTSDQQIADLVSADAHALVIASEVTSQSVYDRKYRRPEWPKGDSGITIGIGFDTGYHSKKEFEAAWKQLLNENHYARLFDTIGFNTSSTHADRAQRVARAKQWVRDLADVDVPWQTALDAYHRCTVQKYGRMVLTALPNAKEMHPHSFGALFSLIYNRGAGMSGDRRREMRNIRGHVENRRFDLIPAEIRAMKRLWIGTEVGGGLVKRREEEAKLFEAGLAAQSMVVAANTAAAAAGADRSLEHAGASGPTFESLRLEATASRPTSAEESDGHNFEEHYAGPEYDERAVLEKGNAWDGVAWPSNDDQSPEYRHIEDRTLKGTVFEFCGKDLELLIRANHFDPIRTEKRIVFALRGAELVTNFANPAVELNQKDRAALTIRETRPDHRTFKCVIGVWNLETGALSAFAASTVPCPRAVYGFQSDTGAKCNMVAAGCYRYGVGLHNGRVPGCLVEWQKKGVRRSKNNLWYDLDDHLDDCRPGDNLHPAFKERSAKFSSWGCLTIQGNWEDGRFTGEYAAFRQALNVTKPGSGDYGRLFDVVLLTGLEAAIASDLRRNGKDTDIGLVEAKLGRLRQGSRGDRVRRLQASLGLPASGEFDSALKKKLVEVQRKQLKWADGVYAPRMDQDLGLTVWAVPEAPMVIASAATGTRLEKAGGGGQSASDLEQLYYELGARSRMARTNRDSYAESALPVPGYHEAMFDMSFSDIVNYGQVVFQRIERSAHSLICGDNDDDRADRQQLHQALSAAALQGENSVVEVLSAALTAYFFLPPSIARKGAEIIVKRTLGATLDATGEFLNGGCKNWAVELRRRQVSGQATAS